MWFFSARTAAVFALSSTLLGLAACGTQSSDVLGQAYVAPATLNLRRELTQKSTVAVLKHGDRVNIVDVRRRFVKIRAAKGAEGWVDSSELLSPEQMDQLRRERDRARSLPSEGMASPYEALNMHLEPDRRSPAFAQIPEGAPVAVLGHRLAPKNNAAPRAPTLVIERPQPPARKPRHETQSKSNAALPPKPPPPRPPPNWEELSAGRVDGSAASGQAQPSIPAKNAPIQNKPVIVEDWTLVRTKDNQCGWVLARNLMMSIPDEVAQYAEGKHITSYFDLGVVNDEAKGPKHNWLWTTSAEPEPYDFDAWRVFLWNRRHHRYETSYRQRGLEGYFPVHVDAPDANPGGRSFEILTKDDDGQFRRRTYLFDGVRVHLIGTEASRPGGAPAESKPAPLDANKLQQNATRPSWLAREWNQLKRRITGGA
jgi:SH3-like domain-containing protein